MKARRTFGSRALVAEQTRDSWGARWMTGFYQDLEFALRSGRRNPVFAAAVVLSLALGIEPDQLMFVAMRMFRLEMVLSPDYVAWRQDHSAFRELAAMQFYGGNPATLAGDDPREVRVTRVSYNFVTTLGVPPAIGRNFEPNEESPRAPRTALLTDPLCWTLDPAITLRDSWLQTVVEAGR